MATPSSPRPRLSVALCTRNGAAHLPRQWQSLLAQDWLPDEVIVSDDASADGTPDLMLAWAKTAPFAVTLLKNAAPLGVNANFGQAIGACTGDLIFICDQDDEWFPEKTRTLATYLANHPQHEAVFANATVADADLHPTGRLFWEVVRFGPTEQAQWLAGQALHVLLGGNRVMGCTLALRAGFRARALPIPETLPGGYIYDGWLALMAAATNQLGFVNQPLQHYRTHPAQQVGVAPPPAGPPVRFTDRFNRPRALKLAPFLAEQRTWQTLLALVQERVGAEAVSLEQLQNRLSHSTLRATLPPGKLGRVWPIANSLLAGRYHRYADAEANALAPYLAALGDLLE